MQSEVNEELTSVNLQQSSKGGGFDAKGEEKEKFLEAGGAEGGEGRGFRWVRAAAPRLRQRFGGDGEGVRWWRPLVASWRAMVQ